MQCQNNYATTTYFLKEDTIVQMNPNIPKKSNNDESTVKGRPVAVHVARQIQPSKKKNAARI